MFIFCFFNFVIIFWIFEIVMGLIFVNGLFKNKNFSLFWLEVKVLVSFVCWCFFFEIWELLVEVIFFKWNLFNRNFKCCFYLWWGIFVCFKIKRILFLILRLWKILGFWVR